MNILANMWYYGLTNTTGSWDYKQYKKMKGRSDKGTAQVIATNTRYLADTGLVANRTIEVTDSRLNPILSCLDTNYDRVRHYKKKPAIYQSNNKHTGQRISSLICSITAYYSRSSSIFRGYLGLYPAGVVAGSGLSVTIGRLATATKKEQYYLLAREKLE